jgi:beta-galactosidase/beta-glucuronidase
MGIYVIDEANVESHGIGYGAASLAKLPNWRKAHVERAVAMVHRDKNHPCVLLWSHGNEAGNGPNIVAMNDAVHSLDPSRPTHYQFATRPICCDTIGGWSRGPRKQQKWHRYLSLDDLRRYAEANESRPLILNEFCHAMGNAVGNLAEYREVFDAYPSIAGGCIWDWVDQGLWKTAPFVGRYIAYGGDFGDHPNDGDFCLNGIVFADRTPTGKLAECQRVFQPISFEMPDPRRIRIHNRHTFADTSRYEFVWQWCRDGEPKESGTLNVPPIAPGESALVPVPRFSVRSADGSGEWMLGVEARLRSPTPWAKAGHRTAIGQFVLEPRNYQKAVEFPAKGPTPILSLTPAEIIFLSKKEKIVFSRKTGYLNSWEYKGRQLIGAGPEPQFWRAPTSNDGPYPVAKRPAKLNPNAKFTAQWIACGLDELKDELVSIDHELLAGKAVVTVKRHLASTDGQTVFDVTLVHTFDSKGGMLLETEITPSGRQPVSLPRAGLQFRLPRAFDRVEWFGRGPGESYPDRKSGMPLGRYSGRVEDQFVNYPVPQENGNKSEVRWLEMKTDDGLGLLVTADRPLNFTASRYETRDLAMARHTFELRPHGYIVLHLDYGMGPLGNASCGNIPPLPKYLLKPGPMKWTMRFKVREE